MESKKANRLKKISLSSKDSRNRRVTDRPPEDRYMNYDDLSDGVSDDDLECSYRPLDSPSPTVTEDIHAETRLDVFFNESESMDRPPTMVEERPRPPSATQYATSMLKKASSVVNEYSNAASNVVQEVKDVIKKHGYCGQFEKEEAKPRERHSFESSYNSVPLRQIRSSPTKTQRMQQPSFLSGPPPYLVRRSASTPTTTSFQQSRSGSAFGRVSSSSSLVGSNTASAFKPISSISIEDKPIESVDSKSMEKKSAAIDKNVINKIKERRKRLGLGKKNEKVGEVANTSSSSKSYVHKSTYSFDSKVVYEINSDDEQPDLVEEKASSPSYVPLDADTHEPDDGSVVPELHSFRKNMSSSGTSYHKIEDDGDAFRSSVTQNNPPLPSKPRRSLTLPGTRQVVTPVPHIDSSTKGGSSPSSYDSCSNSRTTRSSNLSNNTSNQTTSTYNSGTLSCNRSVTSSISADREVRNANRRELRRKEGVDLDGSMSIHSSDTVSTRGYFALNHNPSQPRDGAKLQIERFFARKNGMSKSKSQNSSTGSQPSVPGKTPTLTAQSPMTVSSQSYAQSLSTASTGDEPPPPRFIQTGLHSAGSKIVPMPFTGYSILGNDGIVASSSSSKASRSSSSSRSSKSKKDKIKLKLNQNSRVSTPSSFDYIPVKNLMTPNTSPSQFNYDMPQDIPKPLTQRHRVQNSSSANQNYVTVVHDSETSKGSTEGITFAGRQSSFRPTTSNLVSPDKNFD
jgi:hypothetical protein